MTPCVDAVPTDGLLNWLLYAPIQLENGAHRGAVAGWLDEAQRPAFVYGEVTGYYLTCCEFMAHSGGAGPLLRRLNAAEEWLHSVWRTPPPPTRTYLSSAEPDWRNDAVFTFDCAMMLRGLKGFDHARARRSRRAIESVLLDAVGPDGALRCHAPRPAGQAALPERWSCEEGPYQLKTAAAVLSVPDLSRDLRAAAEATTAKWAGWYRGNEPAGDLHPLFYHLEGLLLEGSRRQDWTFWRLAAEIFVEVMERQRDDGDLPSSLSDASSASRSDVTAQALRLGSLLVDGGFLPVRFVTRLRDLADALCRYIDAGGGVRFRRDDDTMHVNVWCTVFAYQAFSLFERTAAGAALDERTLDAIA